MENRTEYKNAWKRDHTDQKNLTMPKGRLTEIQAAADRAGEKLNAYILNAIDQRMEREKSPSD